MRWIKLVIYLGLDFALLAMALPRLRPWWQLALGPAGWVADPPNLVLWGLFALAGLAHLAALVADVGFGGRRVPGWAHAVLLSVLGGAIVVGSVEAGRATVSWDRLSDAPPSVQAAEVLDRLRGVLAEAYAAEGRFPDDPARLEAALVEADGSPVRSAYWYAGLTRRPIAVRLSKGARGPVVRVPEGVLPGTVLYALDEADGLYWLTAVVGRGTRARPEVLRGPGGGPLVVANGPVGPVTR